MPSCSHFKNDPNKKIVINYIECDPSHFHVIKDPRTKTIARIIFDQNQFTLMDYISKEELNEKDLEILKNGLKYIFLSYTEYAQGSPLALADGSVKERKSMSEPRKIFHFDGMDL